jgi:hypothetical protein
MTWREYHEFTKHTAQALRRTPHVLDWENIPDPFRHYEGVPVLDLPADPPSPEIPVLELLRGARGSTPAARPGPPTPVQADPGAMPLDHGLWLHDDQHILPASPRSPARRSRTAGPKSSRMVAWALSV